MREEQSKWALLGVVGVVVLVGGVRFVAETIQAVRPVRRRQPWDGF